MACPQRVYAATKTLGVYVCEAFTASGDQPTWSTVNGGLPSTAITSFCLDRHEARRDARMFCIVGGTLYRRTIGDWAALMTSEEARSKLNFVAGETLQCVVVDPVTGYVHTLLGNANGGTTAIGVLTSKDHGDTWSGVRVVASSHYYTLGGMDACNGLLVFPFVNFSISCYFEYSTDSGETWQWINVSESSSIPLLCARIHPELADAWYGTYYGNTNIKFELLRCSTSGTYTLLHPGYSCGPYKGGGGFWFDPDDADHIATISGYNDTVFNQTTDAFASYSTAPTSVDSMDEIGDGCEAGSWVQGCSSPSVLLSQAIIYVSADGVTLVNRSGTNWGTSPYTDAIPATCGGVINWGLWCVFDPPTEGPTPGPDQTITIPGESEPVALGGTAYTQSVTMPDYTGAERGEPLPGDRGAFLVDTEAHAALHASDVLQEEARYHLPLWDATVGDAPVFNGTEWAPEPVATPDDLAALALDDLADVDTAGAVDGDVLVYDADTSTWESQEYQGGGANLGHIILVQGAGDIVDYGVASSDNLTAALEDAVSGDVVWLPACSIDGDHVVPSGVTVHGLGTATILTGMFTLQEGAEARSLSIDREVDDASEAWGLASARSGFSYTYVPAKAVGCKVSVSNSGGAVGIGVGDVPLECHECDVEASSSASTAYGVDGTTAELTIFGGRCVGSTAPVRS